MRTMPPASATASFRFSGRADGARAAPRSQATDLGTTPLHFLALIFAIAARPNGPWVWRRLRPDLAHGSRRLGYDLCTRFRAAAMSKRTAAGPAIWALGLALSGCSLAGSAKSYLPHSVWPDHPRRACPDHRRRACPDRRHQSSSRKGAGRALPCGPRNPAKRRSLILYKTPQSRCSLRSRSAHPGED